MTRDAALLDEHGWPETTGPYRHDVIEATGIRVSTIVRESSAIEYVSPYFETMAFWLDRTPGILWHSSATYKRAADRPAACTCGAICARTGKVRAAHEICELPATRSWDDATPMEKIQAEVQSLREGLDHLKNCVEEAIRYGTVRPTSESGAFAADILNEEWSK